MTWVLIIGTAWAISGFKTEGDCIAASKHVHLRYIMQCVPMPDGTLIVPGGS